MPTTKMAKVIIFVCLLVVSTLFSSASAKKVVHDKGTENNATAIIGRGENGEAKNQFNRTHVEDYEHVEIAHHVRPHFVKQLGLPNDPVGVLVSRSPCHCVNGICGCCTGIMMMNAFRSKGCMNLTYYPEEFAFEVKMMFNDRVLYKNRMSGRNPRPICIHPPQLDFIELCANFYDIYFVGRNMHICLDMEAKFQSYELFNRSFNCMRLGDQGVALVKPEEGGGFPQKPGGGTDADIDAGDDDIEDYDENLIRLLL